MYPTYLDEQTIYSHLLYSYSGRPTETPTELPTSSEVPTAAPNILWWPSRQDVDLIIGIVEENRDPIEADILTPRIEIDDDELYSFDNFLSALKVFADGTVQGIFFYVGDGTATNRNTRKRGLVNIAAFLAHAKTEAVYNSICDERNVDSIEEKFPLSNACGQHGVTYQNMRCHPDESFMECPPDPNLQMSAVAPLTGQLGPPEFFCAPTEFFPFTGYYDEPTNELQNDAPFANRGELVVLPSCLANNTHCLTFCPRSREI